jgi:hypothetical protein
LGTEPLHDLDRWLAQYRSFWEDTLDALARYIECADDDRNR